MSDLVLKDSLYGLPKQYTLSVAVSDSGNLAVIAQALLKMSSSLRRPQPASVPVMRQTSTSVPTVPPRHTQPPAEHIQLAQAQYSPHPNVSADSLPENEAVYEPPIDGTYDKGATYDKVISLSPKDIDKIERNVSASHTILVVAVIVEH